MEQGINKAMQEEELAASVTEQKDQILSGQQLDMRTYSPLTLAFIGDAVFSLYIRTVVVAKGNTAPGKLHTQCSELVKAPAQAYMIRQIASELTPEEHSIYKRGRNAQAPSRAKHATMSEYRHATGLETLFGYLYLTGQGERMTQLAKMCLNCYEARSGKMPGCEKESESSK